LIFSPVKIAQLGGGGEVKNAQRIAFWPGLYLKQAKPGRGSVPGGIPTLERGNDVE
jgi:hypothetical protein